MSNHDRSKYGYAVRKPERFMAVGFVKEGCLGCHGDIVPKEPVAFWDNQLMHGDCADKEWELDAD